MTDPDAETAQIAALARELRDIFCRADHAGVDNILALWPAGASQVHPDAPVDLPVTGWLKACAVHAPSATSRFVGRCAALSNRLRWQQTYSSDDLSASFLARYGWTLLVGPEAPVRSASVLAGVLLLGPGVTYPRHQHAAEEAYVILSGTASWTLGEADWAPVDAGRIVHNPSWRWHGMRTDHQEPLLLGFLWKAGAVEKSNLEALR